MNSTHPSHAHKTASRQPALPGGLGPLNVQGQGCTGDIQGPADTRGPACPPDPLSTGASPGRSLCPEETIPHSPSRIWGSRELLRYRKNSSSKPMVLSKAVWKMDLQEHLIHQQCRCQGCPTEPCSPGTPRALSRCCLGPLLQAYRSL